MQVLEAQGALGKRGASGSVATRSRSCCSNASVSSGSGARGSCRIPALVLGVSRTRPFPRLCRARAMLSHSPRTSRRCRPRTSPMRRAVHPDRRTASLSPGGGHLASDGADLLTRHHLVAGLSPSGRPVLRAPDDLAGGPIKLGLEASGKPLQLARGEVEHSTQHHVGTTCGTVSMVGGHAVEPPLNLLRRHRIDGAHPERGQDVCLDAATVVVERRLLATHAADMLQVVCGEGSDVVPVQLGAALDGFPLPALSPDGRRGKRRRLAGRRPER